MVIRSYVQVCTGDPFLVSRVLSQTAEGSLHIMPSAVIPVKCIEVTDFDFVYEHAADEYDTKPTEWPNFTKSVVLYCPTKSPLKIEGLIACTHRSPIVFWPCLLSSKCTAVGGHKSVIPSPKTLLFNTWKSAHSPLAALNSEPTGFECPSWCLNDHGSTVKRTIFDFAVFAYQNQENDFIKLGKEMKIMSNDLLKIGIKSLAVYGILVRDDKLQTFKINLIDCKVYVMTQLSLTQLVKSSDDIALVPNIVARLMQLKDLSVETVKKNFFKNICIGAL
ncbi:hypothetical protein EDC94DRAFT_583097 [Helicostylum pulchrum]|nr:hypothetical protein EDC94DRAFT_583097 [Helicostylum pulchrum]